ncbi:MAG: GDSL-type esterase/lipase family protein [Kofleriaceae bacterium]|nr:GDSL-type esterase/lipase family protein [Kofleriaceae bacterium]
MSAPDRSWTITPTLLWFGGLLVAGLWVSDGSMHALADRLTARRDADAAGPAITARPVVVAELPEDDTDVAPGVPAVSTSSDRASGGALEDTCIDGTPTACKRWAMDGFYRAVEAEKAGKLGRPVRVSWYGDSVVATDAIPGRLRTRLQAELGDGGPGFIFVMPPHRFVHHEGITRAHTGTWLTHAVSTQPAADAIYGVGGSSTETSGGGVTVKLVAGKATNVALHYLGQPNGGLATVKGDGAEVLRAETQARTKQAGMATATVAGGAAKFAIETKGRVRLFGLDLENADGVVVDNLGIVSVNVKNFANREPASWAAELEHRKADLILIMIGANEAQWLGPGDADTKAYATNYQKVLAPIRKARPDATCLVVSPTDQAEAKDGGYSSRPVMPLLVEAQRKAAKASGCAFFSTYDWMGGKGSAAMWFKKGLVGSDFQHLSRKGANKMGDAVHDALMAGYKRYASH